MWLMCSQIYLNNYGGVGKEGDFLGGGGCNSTIYMGSSSISTFQTKPCGFKNLYQGLL